MFVIKGFAQNALFADYAQYPDGLLGRITTYSSTFAKVKRYVTNRQTHPNDSVLAFEFEQDGTPTDIPEALRDRMLDVSSFVFDYTISRPGIQVDHAEIINALINQFTGVARDFSAGLIVRDGQYYAPEYVSWNAVGEDATFTLWFANEAFQRQYPNYSITPISPIWGGAGSPNPADIFFRPGAEVQQLLEDVTMTVMAERMQQAKQNYPETVMSIPAFDYHDPNDPQRIVPAYFGVLIYGLAGNNLDSIKDALQDMLLSNSSRTRDEWIQILPDLFRRTEFLMLPMWNKIAMPDTVVQKGIYSNQVLAQEIVPFVQTYATDYAQAHIAANAMCAGWPWRSVAMCSIGNVENRGGMVRLSQVYPDWISVSSTSTDFNRQSLRTRQWFEIIQRMVYAAEDFEAFDMPPDGIQKLTRNGRLYLSTTIENIHYLVLCKVSI